MIAKGYGVMWVWDVLEPCSILADVVANGISVVNTNSSPDVGDKSAQKVFMETTKTVKSLIRSKDMNKTTIHLAEQN